MSTPPRPFPHRGPAPAPAPRPEGLKGVAPGTAGRGHVGRGLR